MRLLPPCAIVLPLLLLAAAPAFAGGISGHFPPGLAPTGVPILPGAFQGIWNYSETVRDCVSLQVIGAFTGTDTVCTNDAVSPADTTGLGTLVCDGTTTDTGYNVTCSGSQEVTPGCTQNFSIAIVSTLNGNTLTTTSTITISFAGCGTPIPSTCLRYEYTGTRVGSATVECATPVQPTTWSGIKAHYR